jgi:hypothetical protein
MSKTSPLSDDELNLKYHLINKYRDLIARRYDDVIKNIDKTGVMLSQDVAHEIKDFFLSNVYPPPTQRRKLDAAFGELKNFTTNPALIWGLLGSLPVAIMQFGIQFPAAIKAGMTSLQAYTSAIGFESAMLHAAIEKGFKEPLSDEEFFECLRAIQHKSLDTFINEASVLFMVISDATLLTKTMNIMRDVIKRMKSKPDTYTHDQIEAIKIGLDLMEKGYELLAPYDADTKNDIIAFIVENEKEFLAEIHGVKGHK